MIEKAPHLLSSMQEPSSFFPYIHNPTVFSLMDLQGNHVDYALNGKAMLCTALLLFTAILTLLCFHNYLRTLFRDTRRRARRFLSGNTLTAVGSEGLDSSVIKTIPTIVYGYATKSSYFPPLECAVCLLEFENDEKARVLPNCNHTFHVDCIDMWFYSHSNCPLCRAPIQAVNPVNPEETAGSEPGRDGIETNSSSPFSSSSSSSSSFELESCPMQKPELVRIVVEVPTGAPCGIGFR